MNRATAVVVEPYRETDRPLIRQLCCDAAYAGRPLEEWLPMERDLFADLFTAYYTDIEPSNSFVARVGGAFAGYVLTTPDTRNHARIWRRKILLPCIFRILTGQYRLPLRTLRPLMGLALALARCRGLRVPLDAYPGHLHINIKEDFRGFSGAWLALGSRALSHFHELGVEGIHGIVMTSRSRMEAKYERLGFRVLQRCEAPRPPVRGQEKSRWLVLAMTREEMPTEPLSVSSFRTTRGSIRK